MYQNELNLCKNSVWYLDKKPVVSDDRSMIRQTCFCLRIIDINLIKNYYFTADNINTADILPLIFVPVFRVQEEQHLDIIFIAKDYNFS